MRRKYLARCIDLLVVNSVDSQIVRRVAKPQIQWWLCSFNHSVSVRTIIHVSLALLGVWSVKSGLHHAARKPSRDLSTATKTIHLAYILRFYHENQVLVRENIRKERLQVVMFVHQPRSRKATTRHIIVMMACLTVRTVVTYH